MSNSWIGTLVVLLVVAAQVIPAILQAIAKKRAEARAKEVAAARRAQQIPQEFTAPAQASKPQRSSGLRDQGAASATAADDIAARRKAQLEQLRNRRASKRVGTLVQSQGGSGGATPPTSQSGPLGSMGGLGRAQRRTAAAGRSHPAGPDAQIAREIAASRERQQQAEQARRAAEIARKRQVEQVKHVPDPKSRRLGEVGSEPLVARQRLVRPPSIASQLRGPGSLRQAFILKELLESPLSMRDEHLAR